MAIKVAIDLGIFHALAKATSSVTAHELAASASADSFLVGWLSYPFTVLTHATVNNSIDRTINACPCCQWFC